MLREALHEIRLRLRALVYRGRLDRDLEDELAFHLAMRAEKYRAVGLDPDLAQAAAQRRFGNVLGLKEACRELWTLNAVERLAQDLRYGARMLRRSPGFTAVVVLIIALGVGANTAVFSVLNSLVFRSLPVAEPGRLVYFRNPSFSYPIFQELKTRGTVFSSVFAWDNDRLNVAWNGESAPTQVLIVSGDFHSGLGVQAAIGRTIQVTDDDVGASPVAVLSDRFWRRRFEGNPAAVGKSIRIEGLPFTVVGVTPSDFFGVAAAADPEITIPLTAIVRLRPQSAGILRQPTTGWLKLMARLKPTVTRQQADSALQVFWPRVLEATTSEIPADRRQPYLARKTGLASARTGYSPAQSAFSRPLWLLLALVCLLLLVGCASVANLMFARSSARTREIVVRMALGASRRRIWCQLLVESLVLVALGTAGGLLFASWGSDALVRLLSRSGDSVILDVRPDGRVFAFTLCTAALTCLGCSVVPTLQAARVDPGPALKESARIIGWNRNHWRLARGLVVCQVSLSVLLLSGTAVFARNLARLLALDPGFHRDNVLLLITDPAAAGYRGREALFYRQVLDRLQRASGVESASLSAFAPISDTDGAWTGSVSIDGVPHVEAGQDTYFNVVSPGYFATVGTPLLRGRDFGPQDNPSAPRTAIVNEALVRAFFPNVHAIGHRISLGSDLSRKDLEIVGIVKDAKYQRLQEPTRRIAYLPYLPFAEALRGVEIVAEVRTTLPAAAMEQTVRREIRGIDREIPLRFETLTGRIHDTLMTERVVAVVSAFLGAIALLLATASLYGLMAYAVSRRAGEIGVRVALGASRLAVLWLVLRESILLAVLGACVGLAASLGLGRFVEGLLYGVTARDPLALGIASGLMTSVATLAGLVPAHRASLLDPVVTLRQE